MISIYRWFFIIFLLAGPTLQAGQAETEIEEQELRERLTEREDETRVEDPYKVDVFSRPLSLLGQYEASLDYLDRLSLGDPAITPDRILLEQEIEAEAFYPVNDSISFFLQLLLIQEEDLDSDTPENLSDIYFERGEMWIFAEEIAGSPLSLEAGRLEFEDDRLWWWDEDLDALRLTFELESFEVATAVAQELFPARSDSDDIDPEQEELLRTITEVSWDWSDNHALQFFVLTGHDHSSTPSPGTVIRLKEEDESDADLVWFGARITGAFPLNDTGLLGYWADAAWVRGDEELLGLEEAGEQDPEDIEDEPPLPAGRGRVEEITEQDVRGWAIDTGITWLLPVAAEPRFTVGYARGSGDERPESRTDRSFHQTGLHGNEPGFGGVQRFQRYGELLDPELSNLSIITAGLGLSLWENSSLDLVFHHYRLVEKAEALRDARIDTELTGAHRDLGHGVDVIFAVEEWDRIELELSASAFRGGSAFGPEEDEWVYGSFASFRVAF